MQFVLYLFFIEGKIRIISLFNIINIYRVTHKAWYFRDDFTDFFLLSEFLVGPNWFISVLNHLAKYFYNKLNWETTNQTFFNFINNYLFLIFFMKQINWYMYLMQNADNHFSNLLVSWLSCFAHSISCIPRPPRRVYAVSRTDQAICSISISALEFLYLFQLFYLCRFIADIAV